MHIIKGETKNFPDYQVFSVVQRNLQHTLWQMVTREQPTEDVEVELSGVVEADDSSGLVVLHMRNDQEQLLFTNGMDEICMDNAAKLLLLLPNIRQAFVHSGFKPKLERVYLKKIIIRYKGPAIHTGAIVKIEQEDPLEVTS